MSELAELARRTEEAEALAASLQRQLDFLQSRENQRKSQKKQPQTKENVGVSGSSVDIEDLLLGELESKEGIDSRDFGLRHRLLANDIYGAISALAGENYVNPLQKSNQIIVVTPEGKRIILTGSPEMIVLRAIPETGSISMDALEKKVGDKKTLKIGVGKASQRKLISRDKQTKALSRASGVDVKVDLVQDELIKIDSIGEKGVSPQMIKDLKRRKLIQTKTVKFYLISKGPNYQRKFVKPIAEVTMTDVKEFVNEETGAWEGPALKPYNFNALGSLPSVGALHPLMQMRADMRRILLDMGFEEMKTNMFVESSFWNFDALFQPQQHPARDAHDTFFVQNPASAKIESPIYMNRVKKTHAEGGYGSIGWRYDWKKSEGEKNLLRTHTTAVSSRYLYNLAQTKPFVPKKYFSIDRVFRHESIDATHLAEFHQVEGFIADKGLTLGHLIGVIAEFFKRIGVPDVKFKPAYNPYTEPSMEVFGWNEARGDWVEVGNSGVFRPEMLEPMGFPPDVKVIAWGLGLERPCMIKTQKKDIRELFGPRVGADFVRKFPFVRFDRDLRGKGERKVDDGDGDGEEEKKEE